MTLEIKTCGLKTPDAVAAAVDAGADMIGFVFFPPSPRAVIPAEASDLAQGARGKSQIVSLTVDMDDDGLSDIVSILKPDLLQLHGKETPDRVREIKVRFGLPVMKAIGIADADDLPKIARYQDVADRLLIDAKPPKGSDRPGGNGLSFDWQLIASLSKTRPFMLSGGLTVETVADALNATRAPGIDVSSGIERSPGEKDPDLIRHFITTAREAAQVST